MINRILVILAVLFTTSSCGVSQGTSVNIGPVEKVFEHPGNQNELYVRANNWMVKTFKSAKSVIQFSDKESGTVSGRYLFRPSPVASSTYTNSADYDLYALIQINVKDQKSKITITPEPFTTYDSPFVKDENKFTQEKAVKIIKGLITDFDNAMKSKDEDW